MRQRKLLTSWSKERKKTEQGFSIPFKGTPPVTLLLPLGPNP
jgi:hypothetical protein